MNFRQNTIPSLVLSLRKDTVVNMHNDEKFMQYLFARTTKLERLLQQINTFSLYSEEKQIDFIEQNGNVFIDLMMTLRLESEWVVRQVKRQGKTLFFVQEYLSHVEKVLKTLDMILQDI